MVGALLERIDVDAPWLAPYRALLDVLGHRAHADLTVAAALNRLAEMKVDSSLPVRFVSQASLPPGEPYEAFIYRSRQVPTRDNLHDLFNGLVWLRHPALKRRLNELQAAQIELAPVAQHRGALRDVLTVFDENAALWEAPAVLVEALVKRDWHALFVSHRSRWCEAQLMLIGHALMEKLCLPHAAITAHVWLAPTSIDAMLAPAALAAKPWLPLPVLGVPGWWKANEEPAFYEDRRVFRPARAAADAMCPPK